MMMSSPLYVCTTNTQDRKKAEHYGTLYNSFKKNAQIMGEQKAKQVAAQLEAGEEEAKA